MDDTALFERSSRARGSGASGGRADPPGDGALRCQRLLGAEVGRALPGDGECGAGQGRRPPPLAAGAAQGTCPQTGRRDAAPDDRPASRLAGRRGDPAPVEGDPEGAREVHLPGLRADLPAACTLPRDAARLGRTQPAGDDPLREVRAAPAPQPAEGSLRARRDRSQHLDAGRPGGYVCRGAEAAARPDRGARSGGRASARRRYPAGDQGAAAVDLAPRVRIGRSESRSRQDMAMQGTDPYSAPFVWLELLPLFPIDVVRVAGCGLRTNCNAEEEAESHREGCCNGGNHEHAVERFP